MDPKIALLFLLIGSVIGLSYAQTAQSLGRNVAALTLPQC
jgi:hypothetical protein